MTATLTPVTRDRIRWGIVAPGHIAEKFARSLASVPDEAELVAVGSRSLDRASEFAARHAVPHAHGSYEELVARDDLDAIYIASPHNLHRDQAVLAIEAGKNVLVEKPMADTLANTTAIIDAARANGVFCMEAMWTRCHPLVLRARKLVEDGLLGDPRFLWCTFAFRFDGDEDHRLLNPDLAGGAILDLGVYPMHAAHVMLGNPTSMTAEGTTHPPTGVDTTSVAHLRWDRPGQEAAFGTLVSSLDARGDQRLTLFGTLGQLELVNFLNPETLLFTPEGGDTQTFVAQDASFVHEIQEVHRCLRAGVQSAAVPWQASLEVADLLDQWKAGVSGVAD